MLVIAVIVGLGGWLGCDRVLGPQGGPVTSWSISQASSWPHNDVWGASSSDVSAVGDRGTILHYDGTEWSSIATVTDLRLLGIWGTPSGDIFAVGDYGVILRGER